MTVTGIQKSSVVIYLKVSIKLQLAPDCLASAPVLITSRKSAGSVTQNVEKFVLAW
jgi:hypothetical protein